ncbi:MAG: sulfur-carrier protein [Archaeoglobi archaeon]|nr:MoaD family protein [Candidatus Mnemosynella bozhongmuii]MDI3502254.1 sulfur-carrier protein [Archaeoglobi archaeon]MDK2781956.1 sulfur-carrier protein [Archaeoglobi archaeon]
MPRVKIKLFANLREIAGVKEDFVEAETLEEALREIIKKYPALEEKIFPDGELNKSLNIMVNGIHSELQKELREGDEIAIFPPVAGG